MKAFYESTLADKGGDTTDNLVMLAYYSYLNAKKEVIKLVTDTIQYVNNVKNVFDNAKKTCEVADEAITIITNAENTLQVMIDEAVANAAADKSHLDSIEALIAQIEAVRDDIIAGVEGHVTKEEIDERLDQINNSKPSDDDEEEEEEVDTKYVADSSKIVAVTYGKGKTAYKTFILNYNSYSIILEYNGQTYCLDAGEFLTIDHNA